MPPPHRGVYEVQHVHLSLVRWHMEHGCCLGLHGDTSLPLHWQSVQQLLVFRTHGNNPYLEGEGKVRKRERDQTERKQEQIQSSQSRKERLAVCWKCGELEVWAYIAIGRRQHTA